MAKPLIRGALISSCLIISGALNAQTFTHADTLRGTITPERAWWDLQHYDLHVTPDISHKTISGFNTISYKVVQPNTVMQIDLQAPLTIDSVKQRGESQPFTRDGNAWFVHLTRKQRSGNTEEITVWYHGTPREAKHAPWDGGIDWKQDSLGNPWVNSACQGLGASSWWPNKDHQADEPDKGANIFVTVPDSLMDVSNGRLKSVSPTVNGMHTYEWVVKSPINNYDISINIGKYAHWSDTTLGEKGILTLDFYVLAYNLERAKIHFAENVKPMIHCFEYWMGPYPFYEDGYKLVESHNLGMEHQTAVQYGNHYQNGYLGKDLSGTGWGLKWDFIIIHESGHEWFGNNITTQDLADMWVHEGFTNYSETLYTTCQSGKEAGYAYCQGTRKLIRNDKPIIAHYGVNEEGSGDMYYKGGNLLNTIRCIMDDDEKFRQILRGLNRNFYHQTVTSAQVEAYVSKYSGIDLAKTFDQYLRTTQIPTLTYILRANGEHSSVIDFQWTDCVDGFNMPVRFKMPDGSTKLMQASTGQMEATLPFSMAELQRQKTLLDPNIYARESAQ
jgi:aminopeptidase N